MRIHSLQHVWFENLANIELWARAKSYQVTHALLFNGEKLPSVDQFDWLVVMGGPMSVNDERQCPWLIQEKKLIEQAIAKGKPVLGICLGAQLIANVLGGRVYKNSDKEIGWFPINLTEDAKRSQLFNIFPSQFTGFHWHGDTFDLPSGAERIASSEGCLNQAFEYGNHVVGLQFHLELAMPNIRLLIENCGAELVDGKYIQSADAILAGHLQVKETGKLMELLLERIEQVVK